MRPTVALIRTDLPTLTVSPWDSRFGMPTHGHDTTTHGKTKSTNKVKNTLKQIICHCCFHLTHIFEVSRFEILISRFSWAFFQNLQICMWWGLEGLSGAKDLVRRWTCWFHQILASSACLETKMSMTFSCAFSSKHKQNLTRTKANLRWNNQIENSSRAQIMHHTAIRITCDNWRCILISAVNAP